MKVLLLEKIKKLGNIGDLVDVKDGYARNYLLIRKKVLRFTKENEENFKSKKDTIEKLYEEKRLSSIDNADLISGKTLVFIRQAGDDGKLYGSITHKDIINTLSSEFQIHLPVESIIINERIKTIGFHSIAIEMHAEVDSTLRIIVSRSKEEASNTLNNEKKEVQVIEKSDHITK